MRFQWENWCTFLLLLYSLAQHAFAFLMHLEKVAEFLSAGVWTPDGWQRHVFKELWSKSCTGHNEGITDPWAGTHSVDSFPGLDCSAASSAHTPAGTWWDSWALSKILTKKIIYLGAKLIGPNGHLYGHSLTRETNQAKQISIFQKRKKNLKKRSNFVTGYT